VRALLALGTSLATGQRSTLSAGQRSAISGSKPNDDQSDEKNHTTCKNQKWFHILLGIDKADA
jgi:hypothetical protein